MQCSAKSKQSQKRCKRHAIPGGSVCIIHGGGAAQVIAKARQRILEMVDPALARLGQVIRDPESEASSVRAARDVLDRAGLKPVDKLQLEAGIRVPDPGREVLSDAALERLIAMAEEAQLASAEDA